MKQIIITKHGKPEVLQLQETLTPKPGANDVLIKVHFAGVNFSDLMVRMGLYAGGPKPPSPIGSEIGGIIESVGADVKNLKPGQRVSVLCKFQGYASQVCVPASNVVPLPDSFSLEQGGAFLLVYVTAHMMMFDLGNLREGQTILIHGAGGGVGTAAIQLAKSVGARVIGTSSAWKHDRLREMGVDVCIDYGSEDVVKIVKEATKGLGVDLIIDPVGAKNWKKSYACLSPLGKLIVYGNQTIAFGKVRNPLILLKEYFTIPKFHPLKLILSNKGVLGYHLGFLDKVEGRVSASIQGLLKLADDTKISPVVDKIFDHKEVALAHHYMQDRKNFGQIVIDFSNCE